MNCTGFEQELQERVEQRATGLSEAARRHAADCDACRAAWREHQLLAAALVTLQPTPAPAGFADSILNALLSEPAAQSDRDLSTVTPQPRSDAAPTRPQTWWTFSAVAASVLALASLGLLMSPEPPPRQLAQSPLEEPLEVASSVAAVLSDLRTDYQALASETSATARDLAQVLPVPSAAPWTGVSVVTPKDDFPAAPAGVVEVGRSIGTQIADAVDFLWLTMPDEEPRS